MTKIHTADLPEEGEIACPVCAMPGDPTEDDRGTLIHHVRRRFPCRTPLRDLATPSEIGGAA